MRIRMRKGLLRGALAALAAVWSLTAMAETPPCLYYVNWGIVYNGAPSVENEADLPRIDETAPGSGVYRGVVEMAQYNNYFRFYSELQDCPSGEVSWRLGNIGPGVEYNLDQYGRSGIYHAENVREFKNQSPWEEAYTWHFPDYFEGRYEMTVDLNEGSLRVVPVDGFIVGINDATVPDLDDPSGWIGLRNIYDYVAPGKLGLYFYSPYRKSWMSYSGSLGLSNTLYFNQFSETASPAPMEITKWPGGVMRAGYSGSGYQTLYLDPDGTLSYSSPQVYIVGDMSSWSFLEKYRTAASDEAGTIFEVRVPVGTGEFKLTTDDNWECDFGNAGRVVKAADGSYVMSLQERGDNIRFENGMLTAPLTMKVDLENMTATFPPEAPLSEQDDNRQGLAIDPNALYFSTPSDRFELTADAPGSIISEYRRFDKTGGNTWEGSVEVGPYSQADFRLISGVTAAGEPNMVLAPGTADRTLFSVDGYAYSSVVELPDTEAGYWRIVNDSRNTGRVQLTVTLEDGKYILSADNPGAVDKGEIYIVGSPQGWNINSDAMPLRLTDTGGYYGHYNIPAENWGVLLRFYTVLGDWESNSIGTQYEDWSMDYTFDGGILETHCVNGKGSWCLQDWPGGEMYFYVNLSEMRVVFSSEPIEGAGNYIEIPERTPVKEGAFIGREPMYLLEPGVYCGEVYPADPRGAGDELRLFSRLLPISEDEPEWIGSYTLAPAGEAVVDFSVKNAYEFDLVASDALGTMPAAPIVVCNPLAASLYDGRIGVVVDYNKKKIHVGNMGGEYIMDSDRPAPNARNVGEYAGRLLTSNGAILEIPAGKFDVWYAGTYNQTVPDRAVTISFDEDPFVVDNFGPYSDRWYYQRLVCPGWKGGKVMIDGASVYDLTQLKEITAWADRDDTVLRRDGDGLVFTGSVTFGGGDGVPGAHTLSFMIGSKNAHHEDGFGSSYDTYHAFGLGCVEGSGRVYYLEPDPDNLRLVVRDGVATGALGVNGLPFRLPNVAEGTFDVVLDLDNMTLTLTQTEGTSSNMYETVSEEGALLDGAVSSAVPGNGDAAVIEVADVAAEGEDAGFNLAGTQGTVLMPESGSDTRVSFDATGVWTGRYSEVSVPEAKAEGDRSRRVAKARRAAHDAARWLVDIPEGMPSDISILIDEKEKTLTLYSTAHNNGFFIYSRNHGNTPTITDIDSARSRMLMPVAEGVYSGKLRMPEGKTADNFILLKSVMGSLDSYGVQGEFEKYTFDLSADDSSTLSAWDHYESNGAISRLYALGWDLFGEPGWYDITYDTNTATLTVAAGESGVDTVTDESAATLSVVPGRGCLLVTASAETTLTVYTLAGIPVRTLSVPAGTTSVSLPAGFYIAAGRKLVVK